MNKRGKNKHRRGFKAHFTAFLIVLIIMLIVTILLVNQSGLANVTLLTLITQTIHNIIPHSSKSITPPITTTIPPSNVTNTSGVKTKLTTFNESGLPAGTFWSIKFNSITVYSNVNYLEFPSTENIITFFVNNVTVNGCVFIPHPSSSAVTSGTINLINFSAVCTTTINETGLPLNSSWFATYNGISKNSTSNLIHFKTGYGVYNFSLPLVGASGKLFLPYPSSGYLKAGSVLQIVFISPSSNSSKGVTFIEKGLPVGTNWTVSYNNLTLNSSSASILFNTSSGISYPFFKIVSIQQSGCLFTPNPSKGPASPGEIINVNFSANCNTSFTESGLPSKTLWKVSYGNYSLSSSSSSINLSSGYMVSAFSIRDIISGNCTYYPSANVTGTIVSGSEIGVVFVPKCISTFFETGIPKGVSWSVDYDNSTLSSYSNNIGFNASNGTFDFNIKTSVKGGCIYTPYPRNGSIVSGSAENISFTQECHTVFNSSGLPDGVSWAVTYDGGTRDGGYNSSIEFPYYANTSFGYSVSTIQLGNCTFYPSPNTGNIEGGALLKIHFSGSCTTQFSETGLPSGDTWAVTYDNKTNSSSSNLIFSSINGTYSFNASNVPASNGCYYVPNPSSGSLVAGSNESILYVNKCTTAFIDPGLPSGANWTVEFAGVTKHSITQNVSFLLTPGKYYYQVPQTSFNGCNYLPNETSGSASVGESVQLSFNLSTCDTVFTEKGLPSGSSWQVTYDNASIDSQANYLNFNNIPGNYSFSIGSIVLGTCTFTPNESSGTIAAGSDTVIGFLSSCYTDFYESGLPVNSLWRVNYAGYTNSSIGTSIAVHSNYLTSPYTVYNVSVGSQCYYMPQPYSGNDSAGTSVSISYVKECVSSFDEKGLYKGVQWSIEYNDIFSSSSSNSTSVIASPGNHSYSIPDAYGDGCTFVPSVNSGYMVSGDTLNVSFIPVSCTTVLSESGLPNGQKWNATFSTFNTSMSSKLYINTNPGNFTLDVPSLNLSNCIFSANYPSVVRAGSHVSLHFGATCYSNISETGLPAGTNWTLRLHSQYNLDGNLVFSGHSYSTTKSYIEWVSVNTSRSFTIYNVPINSKCYYIPSPSSGSITAGQNLKIIFTNNCVTVFSESGLPSGAKWISEYDGINFTSGSSSASFITSAGPHDFRIYYGKSNGCYYSPNMTSGIINSGSKLTIGFKVVYCLTEFVNIGLPSRTIWSVDYNSSNISSNSSRIIFNTSASNKSLSYNVSPKNISSSNCYIYASGATGSVIPGSNVTINYINLCKTTFIESGLPSGSEWYVNFDKTVNHSNVSSLVVYGLPGTHSFKISVVSVGSGCFYQPSPAAGNVSSGNSESISYSLECNTTFNSTGLPTGAVWNVNYSGSVLSSKSQSIVFTTKPGNYSFSLSSVKFDSCLYTPSPSSGSLLAGGNESVLFTENTCNTTFIESGLPTGTSWKLKYDGIPVSSSENNTSITTPSGIFSLELYPVKILGCTYSPNIYSGSVAAGSRFRVSFSVSCYTYFNETGLPNGTSWFVDYNGTSVSSNISVIQIPSKYGDYAYSIAYVGNSSCYYSSSPSSGYILSGSTLGVKYSGGCTTSFYENGLPLNTNWTMYYNGTEEYSKTSSMQFLTSPGIHNYSIPSLNVSNCLYVPESTSGNLSAGSNMDIIFNQTSCYTSFRTKGLPVGVSWTINFDDNDINYTQASGSLTVQTNPGTFNLTVYTIHNDNCTFLPVPSSARIAAGSSIYINYTSNCVTTLIESGLANGITWSAKYDGITNYSSSNSIEIDSIYGNFSFNVSAIQTSANCYLIPNPSNGTVLSGSSVMTNFSSHCLSQFSESGLPSGAVWSVRYDNKTNSSSSSAVLFDVPYGNYSYNVSSVKYDNCYYTPNSSSGYAVAGHYTSLDFTETVCTAYFYESGLPSGTKWNVTYDNLESSSVSNLTAINTSTGTYPFYVPAQTNSGCIYTAVPSSGDVGAGSNTSITFSRAYCISEFEETGLPAGFSWNVTFDSNTTVSNTSDISFNTTYGTFSYQTSTIISGQCQFIPSPASGSVTTGDHTLIAFTSICKTYFSENGLPSGYKWKVAYDNKTLLSSNSTIEFSTSYGNFDFSVTPVVEYNCGFTPNMSGGHILAGSNLSFTFTNSSCTKPFIMPISLYNNNNVSLPSDYQQELVFNSSEYSRYENTNLSNIMFTYSNGTVIPSWLESGNSNSSNRTVYWLKVGSIPKESGIIIDMIFNQTLKDYAVDFNNVSTGEALQFSPSYVDYNDIQNVMSKGLVYQIYYDSASTGTGVNSAQEIALYGASMSNGTVISTGGQSFIASTPVFITSENVSSQDVDGTTRNYVIDNMQGGYSGGSAFPNPPVSNYNDAFMIKQLGFVQLLNATQFSMEIDDGGTLGVNGSTYNATSWIGGTDNPSNLINDWTSESAKVYSSPIVGAGDYGIELDYINQGGPGYLGLWSNLNAEYYYPTVLVNGLSAEALINQSLVSTTVIETGLPSGYKWSADYDNINKSSNSSNITFSTSSGNHTMNLVALSNVSSVLNCVSTYTPNVTSIILKAGSQVTVHFSASDLCTTSFSEEGLAPNSSWSVLFDGKNLSSVTSKSITFSNVTYGNYSAIASTNLSCSSQSKSVQAGSEILFDDWSCNDTFVTSNIPNGYNFSVTLNNITRTGITGSPLIFPLVSSKSLYDYNASSPSIKYMASGEAYSGTTTYLSTWLITKQFIESGLPTGTNWYVNYNGTAKHSTSNSIVFIVKSSNLSFIIPDVALGAYVYVPNITSGLTGINENTSVSFRRENALIPADLISFIPLNIANSKSIATPAPFQELINLSYSNYSSYANLSNGYNFHNVEFFNETNGKIVDSWLENYTSKYALFWIKLPNGIPANTTITGVAIGFAQKSINLLNNVTTGEAPQLSTTYGKYDDGAGVFNLYTNWAGTSAPSGWTLSSSSDGSASINNGLTIKTGDSDDPSYGYAIYTSSNFMDSAISSYVSTVSISSSVGGMTGNPAAFSSSTSPSSDTGSTCNSFGFVVGLSVCQTDGGSLLAYYLQSNSTQESSLVNSNHWVISGVWTSEVEPLRGYVNHLKVVSNSSYEYTGSLYPIVGASSAGSSSGHPGPTSFTVLWTYVRSNPPNDVMPSVSFGSSIDTPVTLYLNGVANHNDSITYGTQSNFTVIPSKASEYVRLWKKVNGSITPLTNFSKSKSTYLVNLSTGVETIIAGTNSSGISNVSYSQTINKSIPTLTLSTLPSENYVYNGTNITVTAAVSTLNSQVNATLYINGKINQTINSQKTINLGSAFGKYSITLNTGGNQNYTNNSVSLVRQIYPNSSIVEDYIPLNISNTQAIATPAPFQELINLSYPSYEGYINLTNGYKFQNVMFFNETNGKIVDSWLENYTSKYALFWIKLPNGIPANTTISDIAVGFGQKNISLLNNLSTGEAPQLSSTYGEYDDGANVFDFYDNFAGTTINSEYTQVIPSGTTITQNNGITISTDSSATYGGLILTNGFSNSPIQIFGGDVTAVSGVAAGFAIQNGNSASSGGYDFNYWSGSVAYGSMSGGMTGNKNPDLQISTGIMEGAWISSSSQVWYKNYVSTAGSQTAESLPSNNILYPSIGIYSSSSSTSITYQWVRTRAYPPNGIMPSVTFSSSIYTPVTLYLNGVANHNDSITYGTQSNFTAISLNTSKYVRLWKKVNGSITPLTNFSKSKSTYLVNLSTGVETIIAGTNSSGISNVSYSQTINKSIPTLTLSTLPSENYVYNGTNITLTANVSTIGSQVKATIYINGKLNQTITSQKTINLGSAPGNYSIILNTSGNRNYTSSSVSSVIFIYYSSTAEYYIPLNISNTQTIATPAPFQQLINISYSNYSSYANLSNGYDFQNVEFFNETNGKIIDSWLENYTSKYALFWIKLPNGIPANTTISDIAVGFGQKNISLLNNVTTGEAPQLSSTYAEYDDGANVFINYWNFAGTSLPSGWTGSGYTQDNGISISSTGAINYSAVAYSANVTLDIYGDIVYSSSPGQYAWGVYGFGGPTGGNVFGTANSNHVLGGTAGEYYAYGYYEDSTDSSSFYYTSKISNIYEVQSIALTGTTDSYYLGYSKLANSYTQENSKKNYIRFYTGGSNAEDTINMYWLRIRAYPPNGVMPKVLFSSTIAT